MGRYAQEFDRSLSDPEAFWGDAAKNIDWYQAPSVVLDASSPPFYRWFADGTLNTCFNALDRHVRDGRGNQAALIYDSPVTGSQRTYTYAELRDEVARFAGLLRGLGVDKGDRVIVYMPMIPEAVIAMLACARIGAVHSVVFGGFAAPELATRIDDAAPKVVVSASCGIEVSRVIEYKPILDRAIDLAEHKPDHCVILQRPAGAGGADRRARPGLGAGVGRGRAGRLRAGRGDRPAVHLVHLGHHGPAQGRGPRQRRPRGRAAVDHDATSTTAEPGDVFWAASDVGWVVGHSYIVYAPLLAGCTTVLYEGKPVGTPDAGAFWRVIEPSTRSRRCSPPRPRSARSRRKTRTATWPASTTCLDFRYLFLAGERLDPETYPWAGDLLGIPVIDHWWQTETGWPIAADLMGLDPMPTKPGSPTMPVPGYDVRILDADGTEAKPGQTGEIVVRLPLPPGCLPTLWHDDERFVASYMSAHPGYYAHRRRRATATRTGTCT